MWSCERYVEHAIALPPADDRVTLYAPELQKAMLTVPVPTQGNDNFHEVILFSILTVFLTGETRSAAGHMPSASRCAAHGAAASREHTHLTRQPSRVKFHNDRRGTNLTRLDLTWSLRTQNPGFASPSSTFFRHVGSIACIAGACRCARMLHTIDAPTASTHAA